MSFEPITAEVKMIRRQNAKSVCKKLIMGIFVILAVGVSAYLLLLLLMAIM